MRRSFKKHVSYPSMMFISAIFGILLYPWPSLPGSGLNRTANMLTWMLVGVWGLWLLWFIPRYHRTGKAAVLLFAGLLLLNVPSIWTPHIFLPDALCRAAAITALAGLVWLLLALSIRGRERRRIYAVIISSGLLQTALACWQVLLPASAARSLGYDFLHAGGRATGVFGQANLLGSFLASALLCALWLMQSSPRRQTRGFAAAAALPLLAGLMLSGSRSAWLGVALGASVLMLCTSTHRQRLKIVCILLAGLLMGGAALMLRPSVVISSSETEKSFPVTVSERLETDRAASGRERLALTEGALLLIAAHPLAGNGIGSFESAFPNALAQVGRINPFPVTVTHPHNELLYVWSEGGAVAVAGLLCWLCLWLIPFRTLPALLRRRPASRQVIARGALTLPLMVHVMTEFPFYLSAVHGVLMVVLLWLAMPARARRVRTRPAKVRWPVQALVTGLCLAAMVFMVTALQSALRIREAEHARFSDASMLAGVANPVAQAERLQFDLAEENLIRFNTSRDIAWLNRFQQQAGDWLAVHNDAYLTDAMMRISRVQQDRLQAAYWRSRGCMSFHADPRFHCDSPAPKG